MTVLFALGLLTACQQPREVPFEIQFASSATRQAAALVRIEIRDSDCSGTVLWSDSISLSGGAGRGMNLPPVLGSGRYAIDVEARDAECNVIAESCDPRQLPQDADTITITLADETREACPMMQCTAGVCSTDVDPDSGTPVVPDAGPPADCEGDGDCSGGTCRNELCCAGCWEGNTCQGGTAVAACGSAGADCSVCSSGQMCTAGSCANTPGPLNPDLSLSIDTTYVAIEGNLYSAGDNGMQLQRGALVSSTPNVFTRQDITGLEFVRVAAMETTACGITSGGQLYCWGSNIAGLRGTGESDATPVAEPERVGADLWKDVEGGNQHFCAVREDDHVLCWGSNNNMRLGTTGGGVRASPTDVDSSATWLTVSGGDTHTCAVRTTGELYCWGSPADGRLGFEGTEDVGPTQVGVGSDWTAVSAGAEHTCGIRSGDLYCWGLQTFGRLGTDVDTGMLTAPALVDNTREWVSVSAGQFHTCGLTDEGEVLCWGLSRNGETGQGASGQVNTPSRVAGGFQAVDVSWSHSCALREDGGAAAEFVVCWGDGTSGRTGSGDTEPQQSASATMFVPPLE